MSFLRNDAVNRVNLHSAVQALAHGAGAIFFLVYLVRAGVPAPIALVAQAAIQAGRLALRPAVLPLAKRWGIKPLLIAGALGMALQYPVLAIVDGVGPALALLCLVAAIAEVLYYVSYNAYFSAIGDAEHRGQQIGAREAMMAVSAVAGPLLGAWMLLTFGPIWAFAAVAAIQAASALPLLGTPNVAIPGEAPGAFRAAWQGVLLSGIDGWLDAFFFFFWQIALFVSLGESISAYGGAMALAGLVGAACGLVLGRHVDAGHGRRAAFLAYGVAAVIVVARAASLGSPWLAVAAHALGALVVPLLVPSLGTAVYNLAKASPCPLRFLMATEAAWDVGAIGGCLAAAGLLALDAPLPWIVLLALPAIAAGAFMLGRYFEARNGVATAAADRIAARGI
jgi:MFS family permease